MIPGVPLRGIVIGQQGIDTALVQIASEAEVAALAQARTEVAVTPVVLGRLPPDGALMDAMFSAEVYVRMPDGSFRPIGMIREANIRQDRLDVTSYRDAAPVFLGGPRRLCFSGEGPA